MEIEAEATAIKQFKDGDEYDKPLFLGNNDSDSEEEALPPTPKAKTATVVLGKRKVTEVIDVDGDDSKIGTALHERAQGRG
jgi:hypothetical protein